MSPLAYFLQTIPQKPAKKETEPKRNNNSTIEDPIESHEKITVDKEKTEDTEDQEDDSAPNIKVALKEAFSSPTFIFITLGFSVCGFHVAFISTHFPAYLVRNLRKLEAKLILKQYYYYNNSKT
jgi:hypothetical protein